VFLFAPDDQVQVVEPPGFCGGQGGDRIHSGHFAFYLQPEGAPAPERQTAAPWRNQPLEFNEARPDMLTVVPGAPPQQPDLLLVGQYASCNGWELAVLGLSPDGKTLVHYPFRTDKSQQPVLFGHLDLDGPGRLKSTSYNNATGLYTNTTWEVRPAAGIVAAVKTETTKAGGGS
jgi:hypothetical protein